MGLENRITGDLVLSFNGFGHGGSRLLNCQGTVGMIWSGKETGHIDIRVRGEPASHAHLDIATLAERPDGSSCLRLKAYAEAIRGGVSALALYASAALRMVSLRLTRVAPASASS